jgi:hypothetical protein
MRRPTRESPDHRLGDPVNQPLNDLLHRVTIQGSGSRNEHLLGGVAQSTQGVDRLDPSKQGGVVVGLRGGYEMRYCADSPLIYTESAGNIGIN